MDNIQMASKIKQTCKEKHITISQLLKECGIRKSLIYDLEKRNYTPSIASVYVIADYLDVSTDYLLGRTDEPNVKFEDVHYNNIVNGENGDNSPLTVPQEQAELDETTQQLVNAFRQLDLTGKAKVMGVVAELINGN